MQVYNSHDGSDGKHPHRRGGLRQAMEQRSRGQGGPKQHPQSFR